METLIPEQREVSQNRSNSSSKRRVDKIRSRVRIGRYRIKKISHTATLSGLFLSFLKVGLTGFGGGLAVIALIRSLVVKKREWLTEQEFAEAFALAQSLPGTNAGNAATYIGFKLGGWRGAIMAMTGFILPSTLIMILLAVFYSQFRELPDTERLFHGLNSAVVALILVTAWRLGKNTLSKKWQWWVAVAAFIAVVIFGASVIEVVLGAGLIGIYFFAFGEKQLEKLAGFRNNLVLRRQERIKSRRAVERRAAARRRGGKNRQENSQQNESPHNFIGGYLTKALADERQQNLIKAHQLKDQPDSNDGDQSQTPETKSQPSDLVKNNRLYSLAFISVLPLMWANLALLAALSVVFLRIGAVTFGGGFVMIPSIEAEVVVNHQWLSHQEFADATALGQITPGPVLVTATFIGYRVAGIPGALFATVSIFLPAFLLTIAAGSSLKRFHSNKFIQSFLVGVTPAVVGLLVAAAISLGRSGIHTVVGLTIALLATVILLKFRPNPLWVLLGAGVIRFLIGYFLW